MPPAPPLVVLMTRPFGNTNEWRTDWEFGDDSGLALISDGSAVCVPFEDLAHYDLVDRMAEADVCVVRGDLFLDADDRAAAVGAALDPVRWRALTRHVAFRVHLGPGYPASELAGNLLPGLGPFARLKRVLAKAETYHFGGPQVGPVFEFARIVAGARASGQWAAYARAIAAVQRYALTFDIRFRFLSHQVVGLFSGITLDLRGWQDGGLDLASGYDLQARHGPQLPALRQRLGDLMLGDGESFKSLCEEVMEQAPRAADVGAAWASLRHVVVEPNPDSPFQAILKGLESEAGIRELRQRMADIDLLGAWQDQWDGALNRLGGALTGAPGR